MKRVEGGGHRFVYFCNCFSKDYKQKNKKQMFCFPYLKNRKHTNKIA